MVKRVFELVYKEVRGLHQAAYVLGLFAFGSQLLALVRDRMLAHEFGAGIELDLYYAAFRIPDLLYVLFASTLSVYVLIPFVASRIKNEDSSEAQKLLSQIFSVFLLGYTLLAICMWILAPILLPLMFPGLSGSMDELVTVMRILLLQPLFLGLSSLFGVVTQLGHRFVLYALSPLIYNIGIIAGIVFFYPFFGLMGLAIGVVLGALGHMLIQIPLVRASNLSFGFTASFTWPLIREVLSVSIPRAITLAMHQVVLLVLVGIASVMAVGSVAVFQFAYNLQSVPLAVIGASYSIAAFPFLADLFAQKKMDAFRLHIVTALRHIIFWSVPAIGLLIVLRAQVVRVVLGSGEFDWGDTRLTAAVLALLIVSLFAQAINLLIVRAFYAGGNTRTPFYVTFFGSILSIVFTYALYALYVQNPGFVNVLGSLMRIEGVAGSEVVIIGLGYSIAICVQTAILLFFAVRMYAIPTIWLLPNVTKSVTAGVVGALCAYSTLNFFVEGINEASLLGILLQGLLGGVVGIAGIILTYYLLRSPELSEIYKSFHRRIFKTDVVAPQEDVL
jgi:putative peptidoglycan lipid II flippase